MKLKLKTYQIEYPGGHVINIKAKNRRTLDKRLGRDARQNARIRRI